jgi:hypothetical protein
VFNGAAALALQRQWGRDAVGLALASAQSSRIAARAHALLAAGEPFLYGALAEAAFETRPVLKELADARLRALGLIEADGSRVGGEATLWLAMHARHFLSMPDVIKANTSAQRAILAGDELGKAYRQVLSYAFDLLERTRGRSASRGQPQRRVLLVASDWLFERRALLRALSSILPNVEVVVSEDPQFDAHTGELLLAERGSRNEHGQRARRGALLDVELLSRADALVGTLHSTFSDIILERMAVRAQPGARQFVMLASSKASSANPARVAQGPLGLHPCAAADGGADWPTLRALKKLVKSFLARALLPTADVADWPRPRDVAGTRTRTNCADASGAFAYLPLECWFSVGGTSGEDGGRRYLGLHERRRAAKAK